jgi:hypothetical protein
MGAASRSSAIFTKRNRRNRDRNAIVWVGRGLKAAARVDKIKRSYAQMRDTGLLQSLEPVDPPTARTWNT